MKKSIAIDGKYLLAAKEAVSKDKSRPTLCGIHICVDADERWLVEATDSYRVVRVTDGYIGGKNADHDYILPTEALANVKPSDRLIIELETDTGSVTIFKGGAGKAEFKAIDGKYPIVDNLIPKEPIPRACYRYAPQFNPALMVGLMKAAERVFGKNLHVELATLEGEEYKPMMMFGKDDGIELTMLLMPTRYDDKRTLLGAAAKNDNAKLRKELKEREANAEMWKRNCLKAEEKQAELEGQLVELKAKIAAEPKVEEPKKPEPPKPTKPKAAPKKPTAKKPAAKKPADKKPAAKEKPKAAPKKAAKPKKEPEPQKAEPVAMAVSLETMTEWCKEHKGTQAAQYGEGNAIWVYGVGKKAAELQAELKKLGFAWAPKGRHGAGWWAKPKMA